MATASAADAERPNFLVILADDLGYADVGFHGSPDIRTPRLDALAASGVRFANGYVTHPVCGPSRSGLITGRYQARFGMEANVANSPFDPYNGLPVTEKTFATRLKSAGYRTAVIGKWHLGAAPPFHPNNRGFDYFYGFLAGSHTYWPHQIDTRRPLVSDRGAPNYGSNERTRDPLSRNGDAAEFDEYLTTALSRDAARWAAAGDEPFCLYLSYNAPHQPLQAPAELIVKYRSIEDEQRRVYAAMIDAMDQGIGMVLDALAERGKLDNTLVFFLSDNGGLRREATPERPGATFSDNSPFRAGKGSLLEGGCHVPFIASWPAGWPSGVVYDEPVSAIDIGATLVSLGGGDASGPPLDGVDLTPYVTGKIPTPPHEALFWRTRGAGSWAVRTPEAKYVRDGATGMRRPQLFDLLADPYEMTDVRDQRPADRSRLAGLWNRWNAQNEPNKYLHAPDYQQARLQFYRDLRARLDAEAADREPAVIE